MKTLIPERKECAAIGVLFAIAAVLLHRAFLGDAPSSFDHSAHLFNAWQLKENLLRRGPFFWSHLWFAGYPANYFYPIAISLTVVIVNGLTFGLLGLSRSYALTFAFGYLLHGYAVYYLGKYAFGRKIALVAAALFMLDRGAPFSGGWFWIAQVGTWPVAVGVALGLIATVRLVMLFEKGGSRNIAFAGLFTGLALFTHPLELLYFALLAPCLGVAMLAVPDRRPAKEIARDLAVSAAIGLAIASLWLLPFLSSSPFAAHYGLSGSSLSQLASRLYSGQLFDGSESLFPSLDTFAPKDSRVPFKADGLITYVTVLAFIAFPSLLRSRRAPPFLIMLIACSSLLVSSSSIHHWLGTDELESYRHVEFPRLTMVTKPFLFLAAAAAIFSMWRGISASAPPRLRAREYVAMAVAAALLLVLVLPALGIFLDRHLLLQVTYRSQSRLQDDLELAGAWLDRKAAEDPRFFRVAAFGENKDDHSLLMLGTLTKVPIYHLSFTPTINYEYELMPETSYMPGSSDAPEILRAVNARYLLQKTFTPQLKLIETFGPFYLFELPDWNPEPYEIVEGRGDVRLKSFEPEEIVLEASPGSHGLLRLNVSYFSRWHATLDGKEIRIVPTTVGDLSTTGFMTVVLRPGTYRFRFRWGLAEYAGIIGALGGIVAVIALARRGT